MTKNPKHASDFDDQALVQGLQKNDPLAIKHLYTKNFPAVRQLVLQYKGSEEDAKDIFQEGMIVLWNNVRSGAFELRDNVKLSTYLIQICKLRWMDKLKKASSRYEIKQEVFMEPSEEAVVMTEWIDQEEQSLFQKQFAQLGERCQDLLKRFYFMKESLQEIAQVLAIGEASIKNEKYRCMQRLKKIVISQS